MEYIFSLLPFCGGQIAQRNKVIYPNASSQKTWDSSQGILFPLHILFTITLGLSAGLDDSELAFWFIRSFIHCFIEQILIFIKSLYWILLQYYFCFLCFLVLLCFFWLWDVWDLSYLTRNETCTPCIGRQSLNHQTIRDVSSTYSLSDRNVPGAHLGAGDALISKPDKASALTERTFEQARVPNLIRDSHGALKAGRSHCLFFSSVSCLGL